MKRMGVPFSLITVKRFLVLNESHFFQQKEYLLMAYGRNNGQ